MIGVGTTTLRSIVGDRDWTQCQIQHGQVGTYSQGAAWGSLGGKVLRGNITKRKHGGKGILAKPA